MTIQEAIKSGKPFKTPDMNAYLIVKHGFIYWYSDLHPVTVFPAHILLSSDFELLNTENVIALRKPFKPNTHFPDAS